MKKGSDDEFIEGVDEELRLIKARLRKTFSETDDLLRQHAGEPEATADEPEEDTDRSGENEKRDSDATLDRVS